MEREVVHIEIKDKETIAFLEKLRAIKREFKEHVKSEKPLKEFNLSSKINDLK